MLFWVHKVFTENVMREKVSTVEGVCEEEQTNLYDPDITFSPSTNIYLEQSDPGRRPKDRAKPEPLTVRTRRF